MKFEFEGLPQTNRQTEELDDIRPEKDRRLVKVAEVRAAGMLAL
jgi:hypothetical protein